MYKNKLQELCHRRRWDLPKYSATKDGPPHKPSFKASVFVNGATFTSPSAFRSSKQAHNDAAMVAFLSFVPDPPGSSTPSTENDTKEQVEAEKPQSIPIPAQSPVIVDANMDSNQLIHEDTDTLSKSQLQNYAIRNKLDPPIFTVEAESLSHDPHYKATVVVDGESFESPAFFKTIKEAEQAAAKMAVTSLSLDIFKKAIELGDSAPFKTLLLELMEREGFGKPIYKTKQFGPSHMAIFYSTVEIEGEEFHGKASNSKKEAEQDAAKIAYIALNECGLHKYTSLSSYLGENRAVPSIHRSDNAKSKQKLNHEGELMDLDFNETLPSTVKVSINGVNNPYFPHSPEKTMMRNKANTPETDSCLFKVYASYPDVALPEGTIVLPISDSKWVAFSQ